MGDIVARRWRNKTHYKERSQAKWQSLNQTSPIRPGETFLLDLRTETGGGRIVNLIKER